MRVGSLSRQTAEASCQGSLDVADSEAAAADAVANEDDECVASV